MLVFRDADEIPAALLPRAATRLLDYDPGVGTPSPAGCEDGRHAESVRRHVLPAVPAEGAVRRDLLAFGFRSSSRDLLMIAAVSIATGVLALLTPVVTGVVFDSVIPNAERSELVMVAALLVVTALVTSLFNLARGFARAASARQALAVAAVRAVGSAVEPAASVLPGVCGRRPRAAQPCVRANP